MTTFLFADSAGSNTCANISTTKSAPFLFHISDHCDTGCSMPARAISYCVQIVKALLVEVWWTNSNWMRVAPERPHSLQWQQWLQHNDFMPCNQRSLWWKGPRITFLLRYPHFIVIRASRPMKFRYMIPLFPFLYSQSSLLKLCTKATQVLLCQSTFLSTHVHLSISSLFLIV